MFRLLLCVFLIGILFSSSSQAQELQISYLVDSSDAVTIQGIQKEAFTPSETGNTINFANTEYAVWVQVKVPSSVKGQKLQVANPLLETLELYQKENGKFNQTTYGIHLPFEERAYYNRFFIFDVTAGETLYLKVSGLFPLEVPLELVSDQDIAKQINQSNFFFGIYFGLLFALFMYNLFLFFTIRNRAYIYYIFYLAFVGFFYAMLTGYAQMFVYPNTPQFNNFLVTVLALGCIFILAFSAYHLNLKEVSKRNYWVVLGLIAISTIMGILELFIDSVALISLSQVFSLLMSLYLLGLGVYLWIFQKQRQASLYVIAWSAYLVGIILLILSKNLVVPSNFFTNHMIFIGSAMEVILFSIALADRYRVIKQEREDAIAKALSLEKTNAQILEDKVARRTEQLLKANTKLETAFKTVSDQKHDIEEGIYYARKIQRAMLPRQESIKKAFPEHFIFFKPREIVSGDFYFFAQKEEDYFLAAADCTGHGVPGGLMSMIGNDLLHQSLQSGLRQPEKIIEFLGAGIRRILYQDSSDNEDSMTIALVRINQREKKLWFSGAKQGLLVFQDGESKYLEGTAHELGAADKETDYQYEAHEVSFVEPTTIFLGSDGLQDQIGKETGEALGHKKVIEFLEETSHFPIKIQYNQIESFVDQWMHDTPQTDDILLWRIDL